MSLFDKFFLKNQSFCVVPPPQFFEILFVYEILKIRLETLGLRVLVMGGYKMHFVFKGGHALCVLWSLIHICSLCSIFQELPFSFPQCSLRVCRAGAGMPCSRTQHTQVAGLQAPHPSFVYSTTLLRPGVIWLSLCVWVPKGCCRQQGLRGKQFFEPGSKPRSFF